MTILILAVEIDSALNTDTILERLNNEDHNLLKAVVGDGKLVNASAIEDSRNTLYLREHIGSAKADDGTELHFTMSGLRLIAEVEGASLETQASVNLRGLMEAVADQALAFRDEAK